MSCLIILPSVDILENLTEARNSLEELWEKRKVKLDLSLELRCLEHDSNQVRTADTLNYL